MTYLAASISAPSWRAAEDLASRAVQAGAEIVELRLDGLADLTCQEAAAAVEAIQKCKCPLIATCRDMEEGGQKAVGLDHKMAILKTCIQANADYLDCEAKLFARQDVRAVLIPLLKAHPRCRLILSAHRMKDRFEDLELTFETVKSLEPKSLVKLVYYAQEITDCFAALDAQRQIGQEGIVFCMGQAGAMSRILAKKLGAFLAFACLDDQSATAPGQLTIHRLKNRYGWDRLNKKTQIFGLIGSPVEHSIGPDVFNSIFASDGIDAVYLPFLVSASPEQFSQFVDEMMQRKWLDVGGFSVTLPHKTNALDFVNQKGEFVDPLARQIGAVNTIKIGFNGIPTGYNTDYLGAINALTETLAIRPASLCQKKVAVLGAGGAARAVVAGLTHYGANVTIYNRTVRRAETLAKTFGCHAAPLDKIDQDRPEIIINCTSVGMTPNIADCPINPDVINPEMVVFDTVYNPIYTQLIKAGQRAGAKIITGAEMYIRQAVEQYRIFLGRSPDENRMRHIVLKTLTSG